MIFSTLQFAFAGLWPMVWHFGLGGVIIGGCLALAWFTPAWLPLPRKDLVYIAAIVGTALVFEGVGIRDEAARRDAQEKVVSTHVQDAVKKAVTDDTAKDPNDDPRN